MNYETNSKLVKPGDIFVALKGEYYDGHDYINEAINNEAKKIIIDKNININYPHKLVKNSYEYLIKKLSKDTKKICKNFKIIGITGTKGKTTTANIVYQLLNNLNVKCAYIGTLGLMYNNVNEKLLNTTPDILTLNKIFHKLKNENITHIIMEVSSIGIIQKRIKGIHFEEIGFTNLSQDHLDFHQNMHEYLNAKLQIINYLDGLLILNNDDKASDKFKNKYKKYLTIGTKSNYNLINYKLNQNNTIFTFEHNYNSYTICLPYPGKYNIYNYLIALALVNNLGFPIDQIINLTNKLIPIKGRNEIIEKNNKYVVIDYAHSPSSVKAILQTYNELKKGKIITIIGCGGNRDTSKRPIMAKIATDLSDEVIFTTDNPRDEEPLDIINQMIANLDATNYDVIIDRAKAIKKGVKLLRKNDYLIILGKGHEDYQIIKNIKYPFDDKQQALKYLN